MYLLYIDACPRGEGVSRTRLVADAFFDAFGQRHSTVPILRHDLNAMGLLPIDRDTLATREALIDAGDFSGPLFNPGQAFAKANGIVIAAPYWDLMFPAMLKTYIEHIFIRELTFRYEDDQPMGLCRAKRALFLTTAGSPVGDLDFGTRYLDAALTMLGIPRFDSICAEGLDIRGADVPTLLQNAKAQAAQTAAAWE